MPTSMKHLDDSDKYLYGRRSNNMAMSGSHKTTSMYNIERITTHLVELKWLIASPAWTISKLTLCQNRNIVQNSKYTTQNNTTSDVMGLFTLATENLTGINVIIDIVYMFDLGCINTTMCSILLCLV